MSKVPGFLAVPVFTGGVHGKGTDRRKPLGTLVAVPRVGAGFEWGGVRDHCTKVLHGQFKVVGPHPLGGMCTMKSQGRLGGMTDSGLPLKVQAHKLNPVLQGGAR